MSSRKAFSELRDLASHGKTFTFEYKGTAEPVYRLRATSENLYGSKVRVNPWRDLSVARGSFKMTFAEVERGPSTSMNQILRHCFTESSLAESSGMIGEGFVENLIHLNRAVFTTVSCGLGLQAHAEMWI